MTTRAAFVCAAAVGIVLACSDASGPAAPKHLVIAAGDSQSASIGASLSLPLKVSLTGTDNQPFPGAVVTWTVTQGVATAQPPASVTDSAGDATTTLALGLQTGPVQVTASVAGVVPVVFTATAVVVYNFPCPSITPIGFGVSGSLDATDCNINGYYLDVLGFTLPSQRSLSIRLTSSSTDTWVGLYTGDGAFLAMNDDSLLGVVRSSMLNVILPGGSYLLTPSAFGPGVTGDYALSLYDRPALLEGCVLDSTNLVFMNPALHYTNSDRSAVWLTRGVSFPETITTSDCADSTGPHYSDRALIWLDSGAVVTVREASTDFDAFVTLLGPNNFRATNDDSANSAATKNAYLVVQVPASAAYLLQFGTRDTAATGAYTVAIGGVPGTLTAAGAGLGPPRFHR